MPLSYYYIFKSFFFLLLLHVLCFKTLIFYMFYKSLYNMIINDIKFIKITVFLLISLFLLFFKSLKIW